MQVLDTEKMCRTCLNPCLEGNMQNVFNNAVSIKNAANEVVGTISSLLMSCASVQIVAGDDLPHHICLQCLDALIKAYSFKQMCETSDTTWRKLMRAIAAETLEHNNSNTSNGMNNKFINAGDVGNVEASYIPDINISREAQSREHVNVVGTEDLTECMVQDPNQYSIKIESDPLEIVVEENVTKQIPISAFSNQSNNKYMVYLCKVCKACFDTQEEVEKHTKTHRKKRTCKKCGRTFLSQRELCKHDQEAHGTVKKRFTCTECGRKFQHLHGFTLHMDSHAAFSTKLSQDDQNKEQHTESTSGVVKTYSRNQQI